MEQTAGKRAIGYCRVSTEEQAAGGFGLDAQRAKLAEYCAAHGLTLANVHTDAGLSGAREIENRPALFAAVNDLRRGDVLLVAKRDRLGRDVVVVAMVERLIERKGARVLSAAGEGTEGAADDPTAQLQRRIVDAFAEYERLIIKQRTRAALAVKRGRGERIGTVPFGYTLDADRVHFVECPAEQTILARVAELRADGYTLAAIAGELNRQGYTTRRGGEWCAQYVHNLTKKAA